MLFTTAAKYEGKNMSLGIKLCENTFLFMSSPCQCCVNVLCAPLWSQSAVAIREPQQGGKGKSGFLIGNQIRWICSQDSNSS